MTFSSLNKFSLSFLKRHHSVVCLVSGGIDSMTLLELLYREREKTHFSLSVLHFNFHLRGEESVRDEEFVRKEAQKRGVEFICLHTLIQAKTGIQEKARTLRRSYLQKLAKEKGWTHAFMAHQADDQLETLVMRSVRGAGMRGLRGMEFQTRLSSSLILLRPLLSFSRRKIQAWARKEKIGFVEDSSNAKLTYFRNQIRHQTIPQLKKYNLPFLRKLTNESKQFQIRYRHCQQEAQDFLNIFSGEKTFLIENYFTLSEHARFFVIEKLLQKNGFEKQVTSAHFKEIEKLLTEKKKAYRKYGKAIIHFLGSCFAVFPQPVVLPENWEISLSGLGVYDLVSLSQKLAVKETLFDFSLAQSEKKIPQKKIIYLDKSKITFPLSVRSLKPGDRFQPYGFKRTKKISDYLTDLKIPFFVKQKTLVLCKNSKIISVLGYEIDDSVKVEDVTQPCLAFELDTII